MKISFRTFPRILALLILPILTAQNSWAQQPELDEPQQQESSWIKPSKNLKVGAEVMSYRYVEPGLIEHTGLLYGVNGQFNWQGNDLIAGVLDASVIAGKLDYNGALCDVETNACSNYSAKTDDVIFRITHRFDFKITDQFHFFIGPGIRYLFDRGESSGFYTRQGLYFFAPVGFNFQMPINDDSGLIIDLEYDLFISGTMQSKLSEVNSKWGDITHKQTAGSGHKITAGYEFNKQTANPLQIAIFYENWDIAASNYETLYISGQPSTKSYFEPKNFSQSFGVKGFVTY